MKSVPMVFKITMTSKKWEEKKSAHSAGFWLEEFDLVVKTIAFEKWFFQYNPETNDKICNVKKHIFCDDFQTYDYLLFNTNTFIHHKFVPPTCMFYFQFYDRCSSVSTENRIICWTCRYFIMTMCSQQSSFDSMISDQILNSSIRNVHCSCLI